MHIANIEEAFAELDKFYTLDESKAIEPIGILFPRLDIQAETEKLYEIANK